MIHSIEIFSNKFFLLKTVEQIKEMADKAVENQTNQIVAEPTEIVEEDENFIFSS